jgi:uncharacterized membrane protein
MKPLSDGSSKIIILLHLLLYITIFLNVPILRQVIGFIYLTFVPGYVFFRALGANDKSVLLEVFLSVTLSVSLLMFMGLIANTILPFIGINLPLTETPLLLTISLLTLSVFVIWQIRDLNRSPKHYTYFTQFNMNKKGLLLCLVAFIFCILSAIGSVYDSVLLLIFVIGGAAAIFSLGFFLREKISSDYLILAFFLVSLSLLLETSLISSHIMGWDIFGEYAAFQLVLKQGFWIPSANTPAWSIGTILNSILSVTILPTIYSTILNLNGELILKVIFPIIFCFVPVALFKVYESQLGKTLALLATFFFIAEPMVLYGLGPLSLTREMITYLFLTGIMLCFMKKDCEGIDTKTRKVLILLFSAGLAVSHYSLAFLYTFLLIFVYLGMVITRKRNTLLTLPMVILIVSIVFSWYMYVSPPPLTKLVNVFHSIATNFAQDFLNAGRLDPGMGTVLSLTQNANIFSLIHKIIIYLCEFFVLVGVATLIIKRRTIKFDQVFKWMILFAASVLVICLVVPNVAPQLNFSRFYQFAMIFLASMFAVGGLFILGLLNRLSTTLRVIKLSKLRKKIPIKELKLVTLVCILVVFLFFRSGLINTVTNGNPVTYSLDFNRLKTGASAQTNLFYDVYLTQTDLSGAQWLGANTNSASGVYADYGMGIPTLSGYGAMNSSNIQYIFNTTQACNGSYVYLRSLNVLDGVVSDPTVLTGYFNMTSIEPSLSQIDRIYSNGANNIYYAP